MLDLLYIIDIIRVIIIYLLAIGIFMIVAYSDTFYPTFVSLLYAYSPVSLIGIELGISNTWRHFGGPAGQYDCNVIAEITEGELKNKIILYDDSKGICWKNKKINILDMKWFELLMTGEKVVIDATYDYLNRLYSSATDIKIYAETVPMKGFHVSEEVKQAGGTITLIPLPIKEEVENTDV